MNVSLEGLLLRLAAQIERPDRKWKDYYAFAAREVAQHVRETREGKHTVEEFSDFYGFKAESQATPAPTEG